MWIHDPKKPTITNEFGSVNNIIKVPEDHEEEYECLFFYKK
jgi:hypothetical protein